MISKILRNLNEICEWNSVNETWLSWHQFSDFLSLHFTIFQKGTCNLPSSSPSTNYASMRVVKLEQFRSQLQSFKLKIGSTEKQSYFNVTSTAFILESSGYVRDFFFTFLGSAIFSVCGSSVARHLTLNWKRSNFLLVCCSHWRPSGQNFNCNLELPKRLAQTMKLTKMKNHSEIEGLKYEVRNGKVLKSLWLFIHEFG